MKQNFEMQPIKEEKIISEERKKEIAKKFKKTVGILGEKDIADLNTLPIEEIFELLSSWEHAAFHYLHRFPRVETIDLILKLSEQKNFQSYSDKKTIDWIMGIFLHHPETFKKTVEILKNKKDPRVIFETERGTIKMADSVGIVDEICLLEDDLEKNREAFEAYAKKGEIFIYIDKNNKLTCFAIANQMDNFILYVNYLHTRTDERKKGFGEEMLKYLVAKHEILETHLLQGNMLSDKVLKNLGFKKDEQGGRWIHRGSARSSLTVKT